MIRLFVNHAGVTVDVDPATAIDNPYYVSPTIPDPENEGETIPNPDYGPESVGEPETIGVNVSPIGPLAVGYTLGAIADTLRSQEAMAREKNAKVLSDPTLRKGGAKLIAYAIDVTPLVVVS